MSQFPAPPKNGAGTTQRLVRGTIAVRTDLQTRKSHARRSGHSRRAVLLRWAAVLTAVLFALFPFYWTVNSSFQPASHLFRSPADWFPVPGTTESYREVFSDRTFVHALANSVIVAAATTLFSLAAGSLAACALGRWNLPGRRVILGAVLAMAMFPQISVLGAMHGMISHLGLYDRLAGLVLADLLLTLPLTVWVLTGFFRSMPRELEESAWVDGATPFQTFWRVLLPLAAPGLAATGLLAFIAAWNEYLFALSFTITERSRTGGIL